MDDGVQSGACSHSYTWSMQTRWHDLRLYTLFLSLCRRNWVPWSWRKLEESEDASLIETQIAELLCAACIVTAPQANKLRPTQCKRVLE